MRIWMQLVASQSRYPGFIAAVRDLCAKAAAPGTEVEVHGTSSGGAGTQYRAAWNFEMREILDNGIAAGRSGRYDAFVIANGVDSALVELRELLDIPVLAFMESSTHAAASMGERFSVVVPDDKLVPRFEELCREYHMLDRLASVEAIDMQQLQSYDRAFHEEGFALECIGRLRQAASRAVAAGAEVLIAPGPSGALCASRGIFEFDGVPVLASFMWLVKHAEALVAMKKLTGVTVSRQRLYRRPPAEILERITSAHEASVGARSSPK